MMNDLITIDGIELRKKKYENKIIMTSWDIAKMHERDVKDVNQNFKRHQEKFILGLDFFVIPRDKISETQIVIQEFIPNNVKEIPLFTETGYLMLVKTFTDDLSWNRQRMLVNNYFRNINETNNVPKSFKEALFLAYQQAERIEKLEEQAKLNAPKVDFYNDVTGSDTTAEIGTVAKVLNFKSVGRNTLFDILRRQGILQRDNMPFQTYVDRGYFRVVESKWNAPNGDVKVNYKTVVYQKGIEYISKVLRDLGYEKVGEVLN
jgi:phage regulatory protein, rha family